jgi:DNA polymerase V
VAHLISHPSATYVLRTASDAMCGAAILPGSLLLVDSSLQPVDGDIVVARLLSGFTVRRLRLSPPRLVAENENYRTVYIDEEEGAHIVGVVTTIITTPRRTLHVRAASVQGEERSHQADTGIDKKEPPVQPRASSEATNSAMAATSRPSRVISSDCMAWISFSDSGVRHSAC